MKIGIANDHSGIEVKNEIKRFLETNGYEVINYGTDTTDSVDYPVYAFKIGKAILNGEIERGILICRTGIGMSIACNKIKGIRCAKVSNAEEAKYTRLDNDSQVLALSALEDMETLKEICKVFLETKFSNEERHIRRLKLIEECDES